MQIEIKLDTDSHGDLIALAALVDALAGRTAGVTATVSTAAPEAPAVSVATGEFDGSGEPAGTEGSAPSTPSASDLDVSGLPWDERIHSGNKEKNADGSWRKRRGVTDETMASVTAALRAGLAAVAAPPAPVSDTAEDASDDEHPTQPASPAVSAPPPPPPAPPVDTAPATSDATSAGERRTFGSFGEFVSAVQQKPDVSSEAKVYDALNPLAAVFGVADFKSLIKRPDLWSDFYDMVGE